LTGYLDIRLRFFPRQRSCLVTANQRQCAHAGRTAIQLAEGEQLQVC